MRLLLNPFFPAALALMALTACGGPPPGGELVPVDEPTVLAAALEANTRLDDPTMVTFGWRLSEEGLRLSGRGVARVLPPDRARLDLFLGNGEPAAQAVLVDEDLRLPVLLPGGIIPPPPLLWATLGVYRPGRGRLVAASPGPDRQVDVQLNSGEVVRYRFVGDRMHSASLITDGSVVKEVRLEWGEEDLPSEARYRDLAAFRELVISREETEVVSGFPERIWLEGAGMDP